MNSHTLETNAQQPDEPDPISNGLGTKPVVLVGLMGSGKTTIGRRLAEKLGIDFVDSDQEIEIAAQMSVAEIFEKMGEDAFRAGEARVIERLLTDGPTVIATGGGAFINDTTRALIKEKAVSIWLQADVDILVERTSRRDTRPLLKQGDPKAILAALDKERSPFYAEANIHIRSSTGSHDAVIAKIMKKLGEWSKP